LSRKNKQSNGFFVKIAAFRFNNIPVKILLTQVNESVFSVMRWKFQTSLSWWQNSP